MLPNTKKGSLFELVSDYNRNSIFNKIPNQPKSCVKETTILTNTYPLDVYQALALQHLSIILKKHCIAYPLKTYTPFSENELKNWHYDKRNANLASLKKKKI